MINYYELIGVNNKASIQEIDDSINSQIRKWSARVNSSNLDKRQHAEQKLQMLNEAQEILLDTEKRKKYDKGLASCDTDYSLSISNVSDEKNVNNSTSSSSTAAISTDKYIKYFNAGDYNTALLHIDIELQKNPDDEKALLYYAKCLDKRYRKKEASEIYEKIVMLNQENKEALFNLVLYYLYDELKLEYSASSQKAYDKAWTYIKLFEETYPEDINLLIMYIYYYSRPLFCRYTPGDQREECYAKVAYYADEYLDKFPNNIDTFPEENVIDSLVYVNFTKTNATIEEFIKRCEVLEKYYNMFDGKFKKHCHVKAKQLIKGYLNHSKEVVALSEKNKWQFDQGSTKQIIGTIEQLDNLGFKCLRNALNGLKEKTKTGQENSNNKLSKAFIILGALIAGIWFFPGTPFSLKTIVNLVLFVIYQFTLNVYSNDLESRSKPLMYFLTFLPTLILIYYSINWHTYITMAIMIFIQIGSFAFLK